MYGWPEHACPGCSLVADQVAHVAHLNARDTTLVFASRAPQPDIQRVKATMGWDIPWYTMTDSFDADHGVDEWHGTNAFIRDGDRVYRTYFVNNRGDEVMGGTWAYLDLTALGRQEEWEDSPGGLPADPALLLVEMARRLRRRRGAAGDVDNAWLVRGGAAQASTAGLSTSSHHCRKVVGLAVCRVRGTPSSRPSSLARTMSTMPWTNASPIP